MSEAQNRDSTGRLVRGAERSTVPAQRQADHLRGVGSASHASWKPRLVTIVILLASAALAAGVTGLVAAALPRELTAQTDVVGYPIYFDYNIHRLVDLYYVSFFLFPISALLLYVCFTNAYRRLKPDAVLEPLLPAQLPMTVAHISQGGSAAVGTFVRVVLVGVSFGLEVAIGRGGGADRFWLTCAFVAFAYSAGSLALAAFWVMARRGDHTIGSTLAWLNAAAGPLAIAGLLVVSGSTSVTVASDHTVHFYPWLPVWLAIGATGLLEAWLITRMARAPSRVQKLERQVVMAITAPVCLFLVLSSLPGALGSIDMFHEGESLAGGRLVLEQGFFPWRDVLSIHGLLQDQWSPLVGDHIFGASRWGVTAGRTLLLTPVSLIGLYLFAVLMFERSWPLIAAVAVIVVAGLAPALDARFMFWPLLLVLLRWTLDRSSWWLSLLLGAAAAAQAVLIPETAYCAAAVGMILLGRDIYERQSKRFLAVVSTTLLFIAGGFIVVATVAGYLATRGALRDFVFYYVVFAPGHELAGGLPLRASSWTPYTVFLAASPAAAALLSFWYVAASLLRRRKLDTIDWVIGAAGLLALLYYVKFIERADVGHAVESYTMTAPLLALLVYRACTRIDGILSRLTIDKWRLPNFGRTPVATLILVATLVACWRPATGALSLVSGHLHPVVAEEPWLDRLGYSTTDALDSSTYADLDTVLNAYLRPGDWLFDFSNAPALYYYLLDRNPHVRYYHVSVAIPEVAQKDVIAELERDRPRLVVFTNDRYGQPGWDNIPNMVRHYDVSQYLLDHYRPLLSIHGQILYADASANLSPALAQNLRTTEAPVTDNLQYRGMTCDWGTAPNFLSVSPPPRDRVAKVLDLPVESITTDDAALYRARIALPTGATWSDYRWLELETSSGFRPDDWTVSDIATTDQLHRQVLFKTLERSQTRIRVYIGSCPQWHGYGGGPLYISHHRAQAVYAVRLVS